MIAKRKPQNNFICDPEGPWGLVCDSLLHEDGFIMKYRFVDYQMHMVSENDDSIKTIQRLKDIFTQFKDSKN